MAKSNTISLRNFHELDAILASAFRKRDAGKVLFGAVNDGAKVVRKAIRQATPKSKGTKKGINAVPFMENGFNASKKAAELRIKFGIYTRTKQLQQKINMLR